MAIVPRAVGVPWFRREDYDRIRDVCEDELPATFDEWEKMIQGRYDQRVSAGMPLEKVMIDPDELVAFAAGRKIDGSIRAELAVRRIMEKYGRDN